ncbi:hydroxyacid dehydrogenase [Propionibacteriaceae bacterium Y1923]|uniref:hydroxyacid dehydrogenase n=1 Tax=Aestuariimicrobium sp. Y1814 TaxID=3418742 RepID=UPI003C26BC1F
MLLALDDDIFDAFLTPEALGRLAGQARVARAGAQDWTGHPDLAEARVVVTGWGSARLDPEVFARAPRLTALVHTAGTVKAVLDPSAWHRPGFVVSSQVEANAAPVAAHTAALVVLALRGTLGLRERYRRDRRDLFTRRGWVTDPSRGLAGRSVGILSASRIGREVIELLRPHPVQVLLYDPYVSPAEAEALGVTWVASLTELAERSDVFSIHAPWLPETEGMVDAEVLAALHDDATVVNTARGAIVDEAALVAELVTGRLNAVLDVTWPEPPADDSPLWDLDNVFLTPHVAGSLGSELAVMGGQAVDEVLRLLAGKALRHEVDPRSFAQQA